MMKSIPVHSVLIFTGIMLSTLPSISLSCGMDAQVKLISGLASSRRGSARCGGTDDSVEKVAFKLDSYKYKFYKIYRKYKRKQPALTGKVVFGFNVEKNGMISNVKILSATTDHQMFLNDLLKSMQKVKFDPILFGHTEYRYPLEFVAD